MRTEEECREKLAECIVKRDFWNQEVWDLKGKELDYPRQLERCEWQRAAWNERIRTLEYVLGINDII